MARCVPRASRRRSPSRQRRTPRSASRANHIDDACRRDPSCWLALLVVGVTAVSSSAVLVRARRRAGVSRAVAFYRCALASVVLVPIGADPAPRRRSRRSAAAGGGSSSPPGLALAAHFATWIPSLSLTSVARERRARADDAGLWWRPRSAFGERRRGAAGSGSRRDRGIGVIRRRRRRRRRRRAARRPAGHGRRVLRRDLRAARPAPAARAIARAVHGGRCTASAAAGARRRDAHRRHAFARLLLGAVGRCSSR